MRKKITKILILLMICESVVFAIPRSASAVSQINITGDAKALNTDGYLDFTNENSNVKVASDTGKFTGYVFSDDLGWIEFGTTDNAQGPVYVDLNTGYLKGKAYVLNTQNYIDFEANNSNVRIEGTTFSGYVFSEDIGWIDFSDTGVNAASGFMENPLASWSFNENYGQAVNDNSSYDHDGTLGANSGSSTDDPTWTQKDLCVSESCLSFDGGDYVNVSTTATDVKTVSFWVRPKTTTEVLLDLDGGSHKLEATSGTITATGFSSVYVNGNSSKTLTANTWQHIVATTGTAFDANAITLGKVSASYLTGFMDEVRLFATQKSASQVKGLYTAKDSPKEVSSQFGPGNEWMSDGLVGYWKMDETFSLDCATRSVTDYSGSGIGGVSCPVSTGPSTGAGKFGTAASFDGSDDYIPIDIPQGGPLFIQEAEISGGWDSASSPRSTSNFDVLAGDILVAVAAREHNVGGGAALTLTTGGSLSWTKQQEVSENQYTEVAIWTATVDSDKSMSVTFSCNTGVDSDCSWTKWGANVYTYRFSDGVGNSSDYFIPSGYGAPSLNITTTQAYSAIAVVNGDWMGDTGARTWRTNAGTFTETNDITTSGGSRLYAGYHANAGAASTYAVGLSAPTSPTSQKYSIAAVEVKGHDNSPAGLPTNVYTIAFWAKPDSTTESVLAYNGTQYIEISSGVLQANNFVNPKIFIDGVETQTFPDTNWHHVVVTTNETIDPSAFELGRVSSNYYDGSLDEVRLYSRVLSPAEVSQLYNWAPGPVGYWDFNENTGTTSVYDKSGNGNTGTMNGSMTESDWVTGKFGSALDFDGTDDRINAGSASGVDDMKAITAEAWIYARSYGESNLGVIVEKDASQTNTDGWSFQLYNGPNLQLEFVRAFNTSAAAARSETNSYSLNNWHHVAAVWNGSGTGSEIKFYVDGVLKTTTSIADGSSGTSTDVSNNLLIGGDDGAQSFDGIIDEVRVYNYARTPGQIIEDMNAGHPAPGSPVGSAVGHWKFDEGYGDTAYDSSPQGNNGDLAGSGTTCPQSGDSACPSWTNSGKFGKALDFDTSGTTDDYVSVGDDSSLQPGNGSWTATLWANPSDSNQTAPLISKDQSAGPWEQWSMYICGDAACGSSGQNLTAFFTEEGGVTFRTARTNEDVADGNWHMYTMVADKTTDLVRLYVDGIEKITSTGTGGNWPTVNNTDDLIIGASNYGEYFNGSIDEVKVYNSALTQDQIKLLYNQGKAVVFGSTSTNSSGVGTWSDTNAYCPPGQTSACVGPVAHWKMDENTGTTVYDTTGNGNNSTTWTGDTKWIKGKTGSGLSFDGDNDVVRYAETSTTDLGSTSSSYTVSVWFKSTFNNISSSVSLISKHNDSGTYPFHFTIQQTTNIACFQINDGTFYPSACTSTAVNDGNWHLATGIRDVNNDKIYLYLDGKYITENTDTTTLTTANNADISMGASGASYDGRDLNGQIDDVRIYNYARTPAQIAWEYNRGGPVGWWKFNENTGSPTTLYDASGFANNGTANGSMDSSDWLAGKFNSSLDFDGSDDVISISNANQIDLNTGLGQGFTFSAWIYPNTVGETAGRIFQKSSNGSTTDTSSTYCRVSGSTPFDIVCNVDLSTDPGTFTVSGVAPANTWTHVAFSWTNDSDDEVTVWINGKAYTSAAQFSGDPTAESNSLYIGGNGTGASNTRAFDGQIDDVRIFNFEMTQQQINDVYNQGAVHFGP